MSKWTEQQRDAARDYIGEAQPNNPAVLVANIEDFMPPNIRRGFEKLFARMASRVATRDELAPSVLHDGESAS